LSWAVKLKKLMKYRGNTTRADNKTPAQLILHKTKLSVWTQPLENIDLRTGKASISCDVLWSLSMTALLPWNWLFGPWNTS